MPSQEHVDLRWNGHDIGCLRGFFFEGNCNDEIAAAHGTPTQIDYRGCTEYNIRNDCFRDRSAYFNGAGSRINIGSAADIDNLTEFTISVWIHPYSLGGGSNAKIFWKGGYFRLEIQYLSGSYVGLYCKVGYAPTSAESTDSYPIELNEWHCLHVTYSQSGDRKIRFYIDSVEVPHYDIQVASVGTRSSDAAENAFIGDVGDGTRSWYGHMTTFLLYNRVISQTERQWLALKETTLTGAHLRVSQWETRVAVDAAKVSHGMVVFVFDDQFRTQLTNGKPVFDAQNVQGTLFILVNNIGVGDRMNADEINQFRDDSWELGSHSMTHPSALGLTEQQLRAELQDSQNVLEDLFLVPIKNWCWPGGTLGGVPWTRYRNISLEYYRAACGSGEVATLNIMSSLMWYNTDYQGGGIGQANIDLAYNGNKLIVFGTHGVDAARAILLNDLITYAKGKGMPVLTLDQALDRMVKVPTTQLYQKMSLKCLNLHVSLPQTFWQLVSASPGHYILWFHAFTDGSAVTAADVVPWAGFDTITNLCTAFQYIRVRPGTYLCCADFTVETPSAWLIGLQVPALTVPKPPYVTYPQWMLYP